jgi:uncharacterized protein
MSKRLTTLLLVTVACAEASAVASASPGTPALCSDAWYRSIEEKLPTGDGQGHGPDIGSDEWKSVIEFKLGIRDKPNVPSINNEGWCSYVDQIVRASGMSTTSNESAGGTLVVPGPSYACDSVEPGSIEALICGDKELSVLDLKLSDVYKAASKKATSEQPPVLKAEQRGWIKGRNECWKSSDKRGCVLREYRHRIAELEARYRLVPGKGPFSFICEGDPANEVVATFFPTDPPTLIAEHGDAVSLMYLLPSGSGAKYQGRNETFWEHHGEALITWGYGAPQMRCKKAQ